MEFSAYAIAAPSRHGGTIAYSLRTQAMLHLRDELSESELETGGFVGSDACARLLADALVTDPATAPLLERHGFLVDSREAETDALRASYLRDCASDEALVIMVAPTLDCNLACPYCYEREVRHAGTMDEATIDALVRFVERERDLHGYHMLKIGWYGGEPLLAIEVIEELTQRFKALGMDYQSMMLSNLSLADDAMVDRICACDISMVYATLDGTGPLHDDHRPALSGEPTYGRIVGAMEALAERGVAITCVCNLDESNVGEYEALRSRFSRIPGVTFYGAQLFDYRHLFGKVSDFSKPRFELIEDPAVIACLEYDAFLGRNPQDADFESLLRPIRIFCARQLGASYAVVDERGRIYECDGDIGYDDKVLGSISDPENPPRKPYDAFSDPDCLGCEFVPTCLGNCRWTRECCGETCIPFKRIAGEVLADWEDATGELPDDPNIPLSLLRPATYRAPDGPYIPWS